ncbi:hypothetical protein [Heterosigma akashiwo virus 01]|uniref:Uncharacterized protein n=1 Tax=Heterosigma akashiwo virus 01 TaxID=97195 RepID=A0A1C9C583_HAV01|nr:hypothetical protein D1R72_gp118 [Heterosigma akashiwo virus 01]AOM63449.1 hypothetical protein [Heterosigma akashiwo virus 01]
MKNNEHSKHYTRKKYNGKRSLSGFLDIINSTSEPEDDNYLLTILNNENYKNPKIVAMEHFKWTEERLNFELCRKAYTYYKRFPDDKETILDYYHLSEIPEIFDQYVFEIEERENIEN